MQALLYGRGGGQNSKADARKSGLGEISLTRQGQPILAQTYAVRRVPDVERNGYCFSDGVGRISADLCEAVARWGALL